MAKICSTVQQAPTKYVIAKLGSTNKLKNLDLNTNLKANCSEYQTAAENDNTKITSPLIKLMTTNSKDPTLCLFICGFSSPFALFINKLVELSIFKFTKQ